jgi:hypothetical protein
MDLDASRARQGRRSDDGGRLRPPASIEHPALSLDQASALMGDLGFMAFRIPPDADVPDSCLAVVLRDAPTGRHFDPESVSYWILDARHGRVEVADPSVRTPQSRPFSWGTIRLVDRFGARNDFVTFGGRLTATRIGRDAVLLAFRSPAPILRLGGHSQPRDRLADDVAVFFRRLVTRCWVEPVEARLAGVPPQDLWAAFLVHEQARLAASSNLREAMAAEIHAVGRAIADVERYRPDALDAGQRVLAWLALAR